jgi:hypothetical protein
VQALEAFFLDIASGTLAAPRIEETGMSFFGVQGPWYIVGWKMGVTIEKMFGRPGLIECLLDSRKLPATYNRAASEIAAAAGGERLPRWSPALLRAIQAH